MILTIDEYKTLPPYRSDQADALITALLPEIEADFLLIRGMDWRRVTGDLTTGSTTITGPSSLVGVEVGDLVDGTNVRGIVVRITRGDTPSITLDSAADADATGQTLTVYPRGARMIAARMVAFQIREGERDVALSSESIENHSMTADSERVMGYPKSIVGGIKRYGGIG